MATSRCASPHPGRAAPVLGFECVVSGAVHYRNREVEQVRAIVYDCDVLVVGGGIVGLATAFVARPTEHGPNQTTDLAAGDDWDVCVTSIVELAQVITPH